MSYLLVTILPILGLVIVMAFIRLVRGPSIPDRVVALDLLATVGIGVIVVFSLASDQPVLLDIALVVALISFLGTVAFAYYVERRA